jgi:phenylalanyl-tRNA synthetase beta subunit
MKYSYNWLQTHIKEQLPSPSIIADALTAHAFEVEEVLQVEQDTVFDIKVLPDRSHDALSHKGMARELAQLLHLNNIKKDYILPQATAPAFPLAVTDRKASPRFMAMLIRNIVVEDSPSWLKQSLETIGQRSINNIVDATNYVLYDQGKPMHAFDADKVVGAITTRFAKSGESLTTLDGKLVVLDETVLVLADDEGPLDIAGIKGGTKAEVDRNTKNIILVSSNFQSTLIRKTTQKVGIKTDAAKRFENGITSELCAPALLATAELVLKVAKTDSTEISQLTDIYPNPEKWIYKVGVSTQEVNRVLGTDLEDSDIEKLLKRRDLKYTVKTLREVLDTEVDNLLGKSYVNPSNMRQDAPESFSCSSLVSYIYTLAGISMPSISVDKYVFAEKINEQQTSIGDLVFSNTGEGRIYTETVEYKKGTPVPEGIDHVGIYMGDGNVLHASKTIGCVGIEKISTAKNFQGVLSYGRITKDIEEKRYVVEVPAERLDIRIKEDVIDELGKLIGTNDAKPSSVYGFDSRGSVSSNAYYSTVIRNLFIEEGYSEVMTSSFSDDGDISILNSVDPKKNHLRTSLVPGVRAALEKGLYYSAFLGPEETIKVFEIGNTFSKNIEETKIAFGINSKNKKTKKQIKTINQSTFDGVKEKLDLKDILYIEESDPTNESSVIEFSLQDVLKNSKNQNIFTNLSRSEKQTSKYKTLSNFPFITRDIAVFIPNIEAEELLEGTIREHAGELAVKIYQFDKFQKDDETRVSYGYRIVFQAFERTLTDLEIEPYMESVYSELKIKGWEVR